MGILYSLAFLLIFIGAAAVAAAIILEWWSRQRTNRHGRELLPARPAVIAVFTFILVVYGWAALIGYGTWCEEVRHVDMGIGDSWKVPLDHGYTFLMVDTTDDGSLQKDGDSFAPKDSSGHLALLAGVTDVGISGDKVLGVDSSSAFILDMSSDQVTRYQDIDAAAKILPVSPKLESASGFYRRMRWGWPDIAAFGLFCITTMGLLFILVTQSRLKQDE